uniref:Uncharacterized protein rps12 n=1 Tax=Phalaenopsis aphrodite subsp. formosana TaxID=308872 RepID=Q3BAI6_PHAAO|nr:hypothetical protein PhapfoPp086 [Phalaenopsis aphrodite subsp. formosana]AAW82568.1 hypothetical protein [Phalaenopsis aphrodite subsp. formosana]
MKKILFSMLYSRLVGEEPTRYCKKKRVEAEPSQDDMNHPFFLRQGSYYHFRKNWSYFSFPFPFQSSYVFPRPFLRRITPAINYFIFIYELNSNRSNINTRPTETETEFVTCYPLA